MIICAPLDEAFDQAESGKICVFPDHEADQERWFTEWTSALSLGAPLRHETYVNAGFVVLSEERWPNLLTRWWDANSAIPMSEMFVSSGPFRDADQDVLNAILMSELPPDAVSLLPYAGEAYSPRLDSVRVVDEIRLACSFEGHPISILHQSGGPKAWLRDGRGYRYARRNAYVRLLSRVLFGADITMRLEPHEVPWWLRPSRNTLFGRARFGATRLAFMSAKRARNAVLRLERRSLGASKQSDR